MSKMLHDLSEKIEPSIIRALSEIRKIADGLKIDFFIVGATAHDIMMDHIHNITASRMTRDIDIAICVADWKEYEALSDKLIVAGATVDLSQIQRYHFKGAIVDVIPFGAISGADNKISWPPEQATVMSTVGFADIG